MPVIQAFGQWPDAGKQRFVRVPDGSYTVPILCLVDPFNEPYVTERGDYLVRRGTTWRANVRPEALPDDKPLPVNDPRATVWWEVIDHRQPIGGTCRLGLQVLEAWSPVGPEGQPTWVRYARDPHLGQLYRDEGLDEWVALPDGGCQRGQRWVWPDHYAPPSMTRRCNPWPKSWDRRDRGVTSKWGK